MAQPGELGPKTGKQREPTVATTFGIDRHTRRRQRLDVAQDRACADLQLAGKRVGGHPTTLSQQQHQRHQTIGTHESKFLIESPTQDVVIGCEARSGTTTRTEHT